MPKVRNSPNSGFLTLIKELCEYNMKNIENRASPILGTINILEMPVFIWGEFIKLLFVRTLAYVKNIIIVKLLHKKYNKYLLKFALNILRIILLKVTFFTS